MGKGSTQATVRNIPMPVQKSVLGDPNQEDKKEKQELRPGDLNPRHQLLQRLAESIKGGFAPVNSWPWPKRHAGAEEARWE